eukprot:scaffold5636_cov73-Cyclotella_meneghiniana.AAC.2
MVSLEGLHTPEPWSRSTRFRSACLPAASEQHIQSMIILSSNDIAEANHRRSFLKSAAVLFPSYTTVLSSSISNAIVTDTVIVPTIIEATDDKVTIPIDYIPALGAYVSNQQFWKRECWFSLGYSIISASNNVMRRHQHTQRDLSQIFHIPRPPFLTAPSTCSKWSYKHKWGCYQPEKTYDSGYANTIEGFDNSQGLVVWRQAEFTFDEKVKAQNLTFGVFGPDLLDGPGGLFFGLIKDTDSWIRPSFLGQTAYTSFSVDMRKPPKLTLSKQPLIENDNCIPLVRDLNRRYKAPVVHYTAKAAAFVVNGLPLRLDTRMPTYVIFDTGLSGMAVSEELFDGRNLQARKNKEKSLWGEVLIAFETTDGSLLELSAKNPITTPLGQSTQWTRFKGNLIVIGLAFLDNTVMIIDIDDRKLQFAT